MFRRRAGRVLHLLKIGRARGQAAGPEAKLANYGHAEDREASLRAISDEATAAALAVMQDRFYHTPSGEEKEDEEDELATGDSHVNFVDSSTAQCYLTQGPRTNR